MWGCKMFMFVGRRRLVGLVGMTALVASLAGVSAPAQALVDPNPISSWRPDNGIAYTEARVGDMIVLGGTFTSMRSPTGQTAARNRLAAISADTGALLPWAPSIVGSGIRTVVGSPDGSTVYLGGTFSSVGSAARANVAAVSASTGLVTPFAANANGTVMALRFVGERLFMNGAFSKVSGVNRGAGAEVDRSTGALRQWNPNANGGIMAFALAADGSGIFIGGYFTRVANAPRDYLAKVDSTTGALLAWVSGSTCSDTSNPCFVFDIAASSDGLYLATGGPGGRAVALDPATGVQSWWAGADGDMTSVVVDGNKLYVAGHFETAVSGQPRAGIVVLDRRTGAVLPDFSARVVGGSGVWQLLRDGTRLHACGQFTSVGSQAIRKYASFNVLADPPDTQAPARPGSLRAPAALSDSVTLSWAAASDNVATVEYRITRDGAQIGTSTKTFFKDRSVVAGRGYDYSIVAVDGAGNASQPSAVLRVTTELAETRLLQRAAPWSVFSTGSAPSAGWQNADFVETGWSQGVGEFGFGDGDEDTYISPKGVAHYFRASFDVSDPAAIGSARLRLLLDDGAVAYLNGQELARINMPSGTIGNGTVAVNGISGNAEMSYQAVAIPVSMLRAGRNQLAVQVHNQSSASSDISFDAFVSYTAATAPGVEQIIRHVSSGAAWRYLDAGAVPTAGWPTAGFDDSAWRTGASQLGYGDGDEATPISWGPSSTSRAITYYFRISFNAGADISDIVKLQLRAMIDDGAVVYLNGTEVWRFNLPSGAITSDTRASTYVSGSDESRWRSVDLTTAALRTGTNVVAVEVHNESPSSSDITFDLELDALRW